MKTTPNDHGFKILCSGIQIYKKREEKHRIHGCLPQFSFLLQSGFNKQEIPIPNGESLQESSKKWLLGSKLQQNLLKISLSLLPFHPRRRRNKLEMKFQILLRLLSLPDKSHGLPVWFARSHGQAVWPAGLTWVSPVQLQIFTPSYLLSFQTSIYMICLLKPLQKYLNDFINHSKQLAWFNINNSTQIQPSFH